jgi:hypothetical protein
MAQDITPEDKVKLKAKAKKVADKAKEHTEPFSVRSKFGEVQFQTVTQKTDADDVDYIEVYLKGQTENGDPHFKIWNPPLMVRNLDGSLTEDPLQALAEVVARHGGRRKGPRRR